MKKIVLQLFCFIAFVSFSFDQPVVSKEDINILTGNIWKGTLTYIDYSNGKKIEIPVELKVIQTSEESDLWFFMTSFPGEEDHNQTDTVKLSDGGTLFDGEMVKQKFTDDNNRINIITEKEHFEDEKAMLYRFTYIIGNDYFFSGKEESPIGQIHFMQRNFYEYKR